MTLTLGFRFSPTKLDYTKHFVAFEKLYKFLTNNPIFRGNVDSFAILRAKTKNSAFHNYYSSNSTPSIHHKTLKCSLKELSQNRDLIITAPDKRAWVFYMDKSDHVGKMFNILSDFTKFANVNEDWMSQITRCQDKVYRFVEDLFIKLTS